MKGQHGLFLGLVSGFVGVLLFAASHTALAQGNFARLVISGGGLAEPVESTEPALLGFWSFSDFPTMQVAPPTVAGEGYAIERHSGHGPSAWDRLRYYPNASGVGGYLFYEGLLNGASRYDGQWYLVSAAGDAALRRILAEQTASGHALPEPYFLITVIGLLTLAVLAVELYIRFKQHAPLTPRYSYPSTAKTLNPWLPAQ
jgi:hypothetical protein